MKRSLKQTLKAYLRPILHRLPGNVQDKLRILFSRQPKGLEGFHSVPNSVLESILAHMRESDRILLAMLNFRPPTALPSLVEPAFQAVALGGHRVLASHQEASFMLVDVRDAAVAPHIILGRYEMGLQGTLRDLVRPGYHVLEARGRQGYHTLTLARAVSNAGRVFVMETDQDQQSTLRDNLKAHSLENVVEVLEGAKQSFPNQETFQRMPAVPDLVRLDVGGQTASALQELSPILQASANPRLVLSWPKGYCDAQPLHHLVESGMRLWRVGEDGGLANTNAGNALCGADQHAIHLVAAKTLS